MKTLQLFLLIPFYGISQQVILTPPEKLFSETIHWNSQSPVKTQGMKNTCSAFGIAAALETFNGVPKDLSEKYLYAVQKSNDYINKKNTVSGQFLFEYINPLITDGAITEAEMPYNPAATKKWHQTDSELVKYLFEGEVGYVTLITKYKEKAKVFLKEYEYLDRIACKNTDYIKTLLKNGIKAIPVSYEIYQPAWKNYKSSNFNTITPDLGYDIITKMGQPMSFSRIKNLYPDGLADKIINGELNITRNDPDTRQYGGHVVTIIGYDDQGFIIKNSWDTGWRVNGYERVSFDFHKLFAYEALIIKSVTLKN